MRRRHHGDRLLGHVDAETQAGIVNIREPFTQKFHRLVRDIEKNALRAGTFDFRIDRTRDNVSRCERAAPVVAFHKIFAAIVPQHPALAPHRFGNQKRFCFGIK